jgi:hypothetical protein
VDNSWKTVDNSAQLWRSRSLVRRKAKNTTKSHPHIWALYFSIIQIWKVRNRLIISPGSIQGFSTSTLYSFRHPFPDINASIRKQTLHIGVMERPGAFIHIIHLPY